MSSLVVVNSKNRILNLPNTSTSKFSVNLGATVQVSSVMIKSCTFTNVIDNVNEYNNVFSYDAGAGLVSLPAIPPAYYNIDELIALLEPLLDASVGGTNTIVKDPLTGILTFNYGAAVQTLSLSDGNLMADILGVIASDTGTSTSFTATGVVDMAGATQVYLLSRSLTDGANIILKDGVRLPILTELPVLASYGQQNYYKAQNSTLNLVKHRASNNIQEIDLEIVDKDGRTVDLKGTEVVLVVKVFAARDPEI